MDNDSLRDERKEHKLPSSVLETETHLRLDFRQETHTQEVQFRREL